MSVSRRRVLKSTLAFAAASPAIAPCFPAAIPAALATPAATPAAPLAIDSAFLAEQIARIDFEDRPGSASIIVTDRDGASAFAATGSLPDGSTPVPTDRYRIGSITKIFTATLVLGLVDAGTVELDLPASTYIARVPIPESVTVRQLLNHTSGIANYTDRDDLFDLALAEPERIWSPEEIVELIADMENTPPGEGHAYSNTNYILLGILIEEQIGQPFHQVLRDRILDPLALSSTYLDAYESGPGPVGAWSSVTGSETPVTWDYTSIASAAWAAGALVSTGPDLHVFISALFAGDLISDSALAEMTHTALWDYGLGLMSLPLVPDIYGHGGGIPGFTTLLGHSTETGRSAFWALTNDAVDPTPSLAGVVLLLDN